MMDRRHLLQLLGAASGLAVLSGTSSAIPPKVSPFTYCLNMATIRGHKLGFVKELETASKAGFGSVEIWMDSLQAYLDKGGTMPDARKLLNDLGIRVENTIGFAEWIVDDESRRKKGLEQLKREMDLLNQIGCKRIAAPPMGAVNETGFDLRRAAERYRTILELGDQTGVIPHLELWGFSKTLGRLSEVLYVAIETSHPSAKVLLDVYHLYKGGSGINTLPLVNPAAVDIFHMNDYTSSIPPATITDADRIYPGDGIAPIQNMLRMLQKHEKPLILSVEVFNKTYYSQDALAVAKTALSKMKKITAQM